MCICARPAPNSGLHGPESGWLPVQDQRKAVYVLGLATPRMNPTSSWLRRYLLELPFQARCRCCACTCCSAGRLHADTLVLA